MKKLMWFVILVHVYAGAQTRVINGSVVSSNNDTWRFIVSLQNFGQHNCGGSIIGERWVLTAAHCVTDVEGNVNAVDPEHEVAVGSYNLNDMTYYDVKRYVVHPKYDPITTDNDIALIELKEPIFNIDPIKYDTGHSLKAGTRTMVAGWGDTDRSRQESYPNDLQEALVPIVDFDLCNSAQSYNGQLTKNMICAGYMDARRDGCQGDSGGPLIVDHTLVGIVSWGEGCAKKNYPGVYTKVQNYASWIENTVKDDDTLWIPIAVDNMIVVIPF